MSSMGGPKGVLFETPEKPFQPPVSVLRKTIGASVMAASAVIGLVGLEQTIETHQSFSASFAIVALLGILVGNDIRKGKDY